MSEKRPLIITFIGDGCVFSALLVILSLFPKFEGRIGVYSSPLPTFLKIPILSEDIMKVLISIVFLIIAYGFFRLKKWGYWLIVSINVYFLAGWIISYQLSKKQYFYQNPIASIVGLIFITPTIKYFGKKTFKA
ncbi:MAG: hypothetical protein VB130_13830 [Clostridium sp.]|nr:hypothetical protein [Clostridium sp.]